MEWEGEHVPRDPSEFDDLDGVLVHVSEHLGDGILHDGVWNILDVLLLPVECGATHGDHAGLAVIAAVLHVQELDLESIDDLGDGTTVDEHGVGALFDIGLDELAGYISTTSPLTLKRFLTKSISFLSYCIATSLRISSSLEIIMPGRREITKFSYSAGSPSE